MRRASLALLILGFTAQVAWADSCVEVNVDSPALPAWDQGTSGLCYAFSATALIDLYRISKDERTQNSSLPFTFTSPLILGAQSVANRSLSKRSHFYGGWLEQSIEVGFSEGTCQSGLGDHLLNLNAGQLVDQMDEFRRMARAGDLTAAAQMHSWLSTLTEAQVDLPTPEQIQLSFNSEFELFTAQVLSSLCTKSPLSEAPVTRTEDRSYAFGKLPLTLQFDGLLHDKHPVAILFCNDVVTDPKFSPAYGEMCAMHYAVAVGQRLNNGVCEVLMRDSSCSTYERRTGHAVCVDGHHWIERSRLFQTAQSINWLEGR